jgi:hypothetical protein
MLGARPSLVQTLLHGCSRSGVLRGWRCIAATGVPVIWIATQTTAPVHLVRIALGHPHLSKALLKAQLKNDSQSPIVSYRIGWTNVHAKEIKLRKGALIGIAKINPGSTDDVSDQTVAFDASAERVIFFVAEPAFANGSRWKANDEDVEREASTPNPH